MTLNDEDILEVLGEEYKRTPEISKELDITRRGVALRLDKFADRGLVEQKKNGGNLYWRITDKGRKQLEN